MQAVRLGSLAVLALALAGCAGQMPSPPVSSAVVATPPAAVSEVSAKRVQLAQPLPATAAAREAFTRACPALLRRTDRSGLTRPDDWKPACEDRERDPIAFFARHFAAVRLGDGKGLATGYFEPELTGTRSARAGSAAIYAKPDDLAEIDLSPFADDLKDRKIRGRWTGKSFVPFHTRASIEDGALAGRGLELAYADDPVELFFLHIQGSGRLRLPDGEVLRIGYAGQNGHPYVAIGRLLRQRGILQKAGMEEIIAWIRSHPAEGRALMRENPSYVFFRLLDPKLDGPIGSLGVPLLAEANAAADPATLPLGAPILARLAIDGQPTEKLLIASDTGGAIRGPNRIDIFWGAGAKARATASGLAAPLEMLLLLPKAAAARLPQ